MKSTKVAAYTITALIFVMSALSVFNEAYMSAAAAKNKMSKGESIAMFPLYMISDFHENGEGYALGDFKYPFVELNGIINLAMNKNIIPDAVKGTRTVRLEHGGIFYQSETEPEVTYQPERLIALENYLSERNINLCFCPAPSRIPKNSDQYLFGKYYSSNDNTDILIDEISGKIDVLDFRNFMPSDLSEYAEKFFMTDHHWTLPCAFECFTILADKMKNDYAFDFDDEICDISNYTFDTVEKCFVGSQGRRVGSAYGGIDDFTFIIPKFDTDFEKSIPAREICERGDFSKLFILERESLDRQNFFSRFSTDPYSHFVGSNIPLEVVKNYDCENGRRVLLVHDSFGKVLLPFVAMTCAETASIDLRYYTDGTLKEYIESFNPDTVIICYGLSMLRTESMFDFGLQ